MSNEKLAELLWDKDKSMLEFEGFTKESFVKWILKRAEECNWLLEDLLDRA